LSSLPACICCPAAPGSAPPLSYTSSRNNTFTFYSSVATQAAAQATCNQQGGHLASYVSEEEQFEVEQMVGG
jgi:hypothetical protein